MCPVAIVCLQIALLVQMVKLWTARQQQHRKINFYGLCQWQMHHNLWHQSFQKTFTFMVVNTTRGRCSYGYGFLWTQWTQPHFKAGKLLHSSAILSKKMGITQILWCKLLFLEWQSISPSDSSFSLVFTFFLSSSFSMGSTAQHGLAYSMKSNRAYLQKPQALHRKGSFSS